MVLTIEQRIFLVENVFRHNGKYTEEVQDLFARMFSDSEVPHRNAVRNLIVKFRETGSVHDAHRPGRPSSASKIADEIQDKLLKSSKKSEKHLLQKTIVAKKAVHDSLKKKPHLHPCKMSVKEEPIEMIDNSEEDFSVSSQFFAKDKQEMKVEPVEQFFVDDWAHNFGHGFELEDDQHLNMLIEPEIEIKVESEAVPLEDSVNEESQLMSIENDQVYTPVLVKSDLKDLGMKLECDDMKIFDSCESSREGLLEQSPKQNMSTENSDEAFICLECGFEFKKRSYLKKHTLVHSNVKMFKCSECGYECKRKRNLQDHMIMHSNVRPFECLECNFKFKTKTDLRRHMLVHSNIKLFKCPECGFECKRKRNLEDHMLIHSNVKLFKCSECSTEFKRKSYLKSHMVVHSSVKLFKCSECSYECNRKHYLDRHMRIHNSV